MMPPRFEPAYLFYYKDIERCPYTFRESEWSAYNEEKDRENMLIALERYLMILDYLRKIK